MASQRQTQSAGPPTTDPDLFGAVPFSSDAWNEAFSAPARPRAHWQKTLDALQALGAGEITNRQERAQRMRHEDGATFNPFDDQGGSGTPWALEMIPLPLTAGEWATVEAGLTQRAHLLERILADVYGPQNLLREGRLAAELIFANPRFLQACHDVRPAGERYLGLYAVDLYRGEDGRFRVLRDYGANPPGLGYALENRIVMSRVLSGLYHRTQIRRLAPFFQTFHRELSRRASGRREDPGIVLLSPGPDCRIYFEHALLSRYLGYPLVEGQDLTVRNGEVFLKKLAGLEPVDSIFRHISDDLSDPFALRRTTANGVAGLIQASRERRIDIVNPVGSGFIETPALQGFLPDLCRLLTGDDLLLENHPVWWCGAADALEYVLANRNRLTVVPAMDPAAAGAAEPTEQQIRAAPHAFLAQAPLLPATVPAWTPQGTGTRPTLLRVFACATETGFAFMPGGLAVTAPDTATLRDGTPERQQSKDIWVLSEQPVEPFSLLEGLRSVDELRRDSDLPSRVADHLLWLGRYMERAEGLVRLLRSTFRRLSGEARPQDVPELPFLLNLLPADNPDGPRESANGDALPRYRELDARLQVLLYRQDRLESVAAILVRVREAARNVRDRLSRDAWRVINRLEGYAAPPDGDPLDLLEDTLFTLSAFSGMAMESMTRGLGWRFMDMGRRVERALNQCRLLRVGLPRVCTEDGNALEALLEVSDSIMTYRARYRTAFQLAPVLDLLIVDESNPKSLAFQCRRLAAHVERLPRRTDRRFASPEERLALEMLTAVRLLDLAGVACGREAPEDETLPAFFRSMETNLKELAQRITAHYLSRVPATPHYSVILDDRTP